MNSYEEKLEARKRRLLARAERAQAEARAAATAAGAIADRIPMGQPILLGHHSERRHRRDLERIDRNMRKASEASARAEELRRRADNLGTTISSEDPGAIEKLEEKLENLEASREIMKQVNATYRKGGWNAVRAKGLLNDAQIAEAEHTMRFVPGGTDKPFPSYTFGNLSNEIARVKKRIAELEAGPPELEPIEGDGWRIEARTDLNRVTISFDAKPAAEIIQRLKRGGWRWSPREGAWMRLLNKATIWAVHDAIKFLPMAGLPGVAENADADADDEPAHESDDDDDGSGPIYRQSIPRRTKKSAHRGKKSAKKTAAKKTAAKKTAAKKTAAMRTPAPKRASRKKKSARDGGSDAGFAKWITHPTSRTRLYAKDYGLKAFPLRGSERSQ